MVSDARGAARRIYPSDSGVESLTGQAQLTLFTSARRPLCKRFSVEAGKIKKQAVADLYDGTAKTVAAPTAADLNALLDGLNHRQAVSAGILEHGQRAKITTAAKEGQSGGTSRSLRNFTFPAAPGWLLWDYDDKTMPGNVRARVEALGGPVRAFLRLWPEAKGAACVIRPSSSDGVSAPGAAEINSAGLHGFFLVNDVSRSREILE
ncbi:hypothetical protein, partial [Tropicimonas sp. IMCC6043]|uniref:hypothetical protein n=1 Tax=Tropicimonas sp. IMCC6043 TaxID=2510645 RepID=UPI00101CA4CD